MPEMNITPEQLLQMFQGEQSKLEIVQRNRLTLQNLLREHVFAIEALKEVRDTRENEHLMVPLGAGAYLDVMLKNNKEVQASITGDVVVKEKIPEVIKKLEARKNDAIEKDMKLAQEQERILQNVRNMERILQQLSQRRK